MQWIGAGFVNVELFGSLMAAMSDAFPYVHVYRPVPAAMVFMASDQPLDLLESMSADAARWHGTSTLDMRNAVAAGLLHGPAQFDAHLAELGVQAPDSSLGWMFAEARRRAGVTAA